jgi:hypothetical protein
MWKSNKAVPLHVHHHFCRKAREGTNISIILRKKPSFPRTALQEGSLGRESSFPVLHELASLTCSKGIISCCDVSTFKHKNKTHAQMKPNYASESE